MLPKDRKSTASTDEIPHRRRRRRPPWYVRYWALFPMVAIGIAYPFFYNWWTLRPAPRHLPLPGYVADTDALNAEFLKYQGKPVGDPAIDGDFNEAAALMNKGDYSASVVLLETLTKTAPVPVIFNDLGVVYLKLNDGTKAVDAFREALSRDLQYPPVRQNITHYKLSSAAEPVTKEVEPNGNPRVANVISLGKPVEAEISLDVNDVDYFRVISPPAPRDLLLVELANHSQTLAPRLRLFDADDHPLDWSKESQDPGVSLREVISPAPNMPLYLRIEGMIATAGAYSLTVTPMKAYDSYEPNDDIISATKIGLDQTVSANIMDGQDIDYFSFRGSERGTVTIDIQNRSKTLIPALTTYSPDMTADNAAPKLTTPGSDLRFSMKVQSGKTYYLQISSQSKTAGDYSLTIK
jgi:hypothetical protein